MGYVIHTQLTQTHIHTPTTHFLLRRSGRDSILRAQRAEGGFVRVYKGFSVAAADGVVGSQVPVAAHNDVSHLGHAPVHVASTGTIRKGAEDTA